MPIADSKPAVPHRATEERTRVLRFRSTELFNGGRRVIIEHGSGDYCLLLTRNDRLILTKN
ncbi:MAG: hemin uptake protein HemP [Nevskiaceae bacterium]|nr:MAG: hemin uptake protein HemP [Nevskiaceae bacterium]TBR73249.1 MAG: hemin uptake protein HemP [Nevskiaceae bacterium]